MVIVADDHIPFLKGVLEPYAKVVYLQGSGITRNDLLNADGLIVRTRTKCDRDLLEGTSVRFIATATIGFDHIDTEYCDANDIRWVHAPGCNSSSVMQYVGAALALISLKDNEHLAGKAIGIIGAGNVGTKVARLALELGMVPLVNDPPRELLEGKQGFTDLDKLLAASDIVTLHVPLNPGGPFKTFHLADDPFMEKMIRKPLLINTSRGEVVDTGAVKRALASGRIGGYVADVWEHEPDIDLELMRLARIATPHIAGYSMEGKANGTAACVRAASRFFGFGIDDWYPGHLPAPLLPEISIITAGKTDEQVISEAITGSYDIRLDDSAFRDDPGSFEKLRNFYPTRREFGAYTVRMTPKHPELEVKLRGLGFNTPFYHH